jgi:hypothetical protein
MSNYYVFVKENYFRPVKVEADSIEDAIDKVASEKGESLTIEHHSTGHWTEWLVEDETGIRHYHCVGIGYVKF